MLAGPLRRVREHVWGQACVHWGQGALGRVLLNDLHKWGQSGPPLPQFPCLYSEVGVCMASEAPSKVSHRMLV